MIYILCILLVSVCAIIAGRYSSRKVLFLIAFILSLFCGLRGTEVGVDTNNYYIFLSDIRERGIGYGSDIGFSIISYFLMGILKDPHKTLMVYAFITNYLIIYRLWDFKEKASFPMMILIYTVVHYLYTFNIVRQFLAISIAFWATKYLERNKYFKYVLLNMIAASCHTSALVCFGYLFVKRGFGTEKNKLRYLGFGLGIVFVFIGLFMFSTNAQKYEQYFVQISGGSIHTMTILKSAFVLLIVLSNRTLRNPVFSRSTTGKYVPMNKEVITVYLFGLFLSGLGMFFTYMNRIGFYFLMYEMPFWGQSVRASLNKGIYRLLIAAILIYVIVSTFIFDTSGLISYMTYLEIT